MLMFSALRNKTVSRLWMGELTSAVGDEIYKVAFVWLAVGMIGSNTGYITALQTLALLCLGLLGGKWSDWWNPYRTLIRIDVLRAMITLTPVILYYLDITSFPALVLSSVLLVGLGAFFEPALQSSIPQLVTDKTILRGANGLFSTSMRLARVMGPAIIGILSGFVSTIHFFTLNAISFIVSVWSIYSIRKKFPAHTTAHLKKGDHMLQNFLDSWKLLKTNRELYKVVIAKTIAGGAWGLAYGLGFALLIHETNPTDVKAFGLLMTSYGVGNALAAIIVGNMQRVRSAFLVHLGLLWLGVGFIGIALSHSFPLLLFFAAFTAVGGPLNDLPCTDLIQAKIELKDLPKIFRLRMTLDNAAAFAFMLVSPFVFKLFAVRTVILACGTITIAAAAWGLFERRQKAA